MSEKIKLRKNLNLSASNLYFILFCFSSQGFPVSLEPVLELALVDQADFEFTEIRLPLPPECWDQRLAPPPPGSPSNL